MGKRKLQLLAFFSITLTYAANTHAANTIYPLVAYKCDTEADIITLTNSLLRNNEGAAYKYSDEEGTYSPWDLIEIEQRARSTRIIRTKKIKKICKLSSGEYTIIIEPQIFNHSMSGICGASISSAFTVIFDEAEIQKRTPFEDYCRGNSPVITRVTVFGKTGEVKIKHLPRYEFY